MVRQVNNKVKLATKVQLKKKASKAKSKVNSKTKSKLTLAQRFEILAGSPTFTKRYLLFSLVVLLSTTLYWSISSARIQMSNADQLVNPFLFEHANTFHKALLPAAHSFLFKWPLFWLVKFFGYTSAAYLTITVLIVLATIASLAAILYRIDRRPLIFGTLCLALASTLLLVPTQPYAGGLLPVNMAMLTTRNLEYILYIIGLYLIIGSQKLKSKGFWLGVLSLCLLIASDKLFFTLSLGGALLANIVYVLVRGWKMASLSVQWFIATILAGTFSLATLWLIQTHKITRIGSQVSAGPYGLAKNVHDITLGVIYGTIGLFTNFGANPAYGETVLRKIPHQLITNLFGIGGVAYVINSLILLCGLYMASRLVISSVTHRRRSTINHDAQTKLSSLLIWSTITAFGVFIATIHYYAVDSRYLSIALFAIFIAAATYISKREWLPKVVLSVGLIIFIGMLFGLFGAGRTFHSESAAMVDINNRNALIAQALSNRQSQVLVGDYWRVVPIKFLTRDHQSIVPLSNCTQLRDALSSQAWQPNLTKHSFTYLLSLDRSLTDYPNCSLKQIVDAYGRPNGSAVIAGSLSKPKELLLFYDHGAHQSAPNTTQRPQGPTTVVPATFDQLPSTSCNVPTIFTVVAHQDDDLLFMNPDLLHSIKAGDCIRTVYVTAGDGGNSSFYWLGREQGSEAAYSKMLGVNDIWIQRIVQLTSTEYVEVATPRDNPKISLVFMHLPDGNLKGDGFKGSNFESLASLDAGKINVMHAVDGQSSYSAAELTQALITLMHTFQPTEIRTQANFISFNYPDHSDHMAVGRFVNRAYPQYEQQQYGGLVTIPIKFYIGYPIHQRQQNVSGTDLQQKEDAYFAYSYHDGAVCHTINQCKGDSTFGLYLSRQYQNPN